jgi:hypothetical protein
MKKETDFMKNVLSNPRRPDKRATLYLGENQDFQDRIEYKNEDLPIHNTKCPYQNMLELLHIIEDFTTLCGVTGLLEFANHTCATHVS